MVDRLIHQVFFSTFVLDLAEIHLKIPTSLFFTLRKHGFNWFNTIKYWDDTVLFEWLLRYKQMSEIYFWIASNFTANVFKVAIKVLE